MLGSKLDQQIEMKDRQAAAGHDQSAVRCAREISDAAFDFTRALQVDWDHLHAQNRRDRLDRRPRADPGGNGRIACHRRARRGWRNLLEKL